MTTIRCRVCLKELDIRPPVGRQEMCTFCGADLHCCLNCRFYKIDAYNYCQEPQAERVIEKSRNNFCGYFSFVSVQSANQKDASEKIENARMKLESLFKKE